MTDTSSPPPYVVDGPPVETKSQLAKSMEANSSGKHVPLNETISDCSDIRPVQNRKCKVELYYIAIALVLGAGLLGVLIYFTVIHTQGNTPELAPEHSAVKSDGGDMGLDLPQAGLLDNNQITDDETISQQIGLPTGSQSKSTRIGDGRSLAEGSVVPASTPATTNNEQSGSSGISGQLRNLRNMRMLPQSGAPAGVTEGPSTSEVKTDTGSSGQTNNDQGINGQPDISPQLRNLRNMRMLPQSGAPVTNSTVSDADSGKSGGSTDGTSSSDVKTETGSSGQTNNDQVISAQPDIAPQLKSLRSMRMPSKSEPVVNTTVSDAGSGNQAGGIDGPSSSDVKIETESSGQSSNDQAPVIPQTRSLRTMRILRVAPQSSDMETTEAPVNSEDNKGDGESSIRSGSTDGGSLPNKDTDGQVSSGQLTDIQAAPVVPQARTLRRMRLVRVPPQSPDMETTDSPANTDEDRIEAGNDNAQAGIVSNNDMTGQGGVQSPDSQAPVVPQPRSLRTMKLLSMAPRASDPETTDDPSNIDDGGDY